MAVRFTGDWMRARRALEGGGPRFHRAIVRAVHAEAQYLRKEIVLNIRDQRDFEPLSPWTIAKRKVMRFGGTKALIQRGDLVGSIGVVKVDDDEVFVGIPRSAKGRARGGAQGKTGEELVRIGAVHEFGTDPIVIPITPKMRRMMALIASKLPREGGRRRNKKTGRFQQESALKGTGARALVVQIPARPFLRPAFDRWKVGVQRRLYRRIAQNMGWL